MREYLQYVADQRLSRHGLPARYGSRNPFPFMALQDVQELANFFERRVTAYQVAVAGSVSLVGKFCTSRSSVEIDRKLPDGSSNSS